MESLLKMKKKNNIFENIESVLDFQVMKNDGNLRKYKEHFEYRTKKFLEKLNK